jgi:hypothetical protein
MEHDPVRTTVLANKLDVTFVPLIEHSTMEINRERVTKAPPSINLGPLIRRKYSYTIRPLHPEKWLSVPLEYGLAVR